jgi:single-strand DNA-binding protein
MSSFTINRVVLIGRLTRDPELRALPSGLGVCNLRIACNSARRDTDGAYRDKPNYFDVSVFGAAAESVSRYTHKGSRVAIDGRLEWREWESADRSKIGQQKRQAVSVVADTVLFLERPERADGGRREDEPSDGFDADRGSSGERYEGSPGELVAVGAGAEDDDLVF